MVALNLNRIFIIAEVGSVHDGSIGNALKLIELAKYVGADAVKFQTHISEAESLPNAPEPSYFKSEPRYEYFKRTAFRFEQWAELKKKAEELVIEFLSSPFSIEAVDILETLGVNYYKVPSGEITNLPLLEVVAKTNKPILLSSGMSSWNELDDAVQLIKEYNSRLIVMQCTSAYPCPYEKVGLNILKEIEDRYKLPVGFSDHTLSIYASIAAVAYGARVIEKHLTYSRYMYGSDARHSLEPFEFKQMVEGIRAVEDMLDNPVNKDEIGEFEEMKNVFQKSIVAAQEIPANVVLNKDMLAYKKPGTGIAPSKVYEIVGRKTLKAIRKDDIISPDMLI